VLELVECTFSIQFLFVEVAVVEVRLWVGGNAEINFNSRDFWDSMWFFLEGVVVDSGSSDGVEVDGDWCDLYVTDMERFWELFNFSVLSEETESVIVVSATDCTLDIHVDIGSSVSLSKFL
jgi:hypothetical protein